MAAWLTAHSFAYLRIAESVTVSGARLGHLRKLFQTARKLHRDGHRDAYERAAVEIYGFLREAWERALEEVLLGGVVERFRVGVQTRQVGLLADITQADCWAVTSAMTKCSRWLRGHDDAPAARADIPEPDEVEGDIDALDAFLAGIRKRRR